MRSHVTKVLALAMGALSACVAANGGLAGAGGNAAACQAFLKGAACGAIGPGGIDCGAYSNVACDLGPYFSCLAGAYVCVNGMYDPAKLATLGQCAPLANCEAPPLDMAVPTPADGAMPAPDFGDHGVSFPLTGQMRNKVDVLFMVDNSNSMEAMSVELRNRFGSMIQALQALAQNGAAVDLNLGVVTSDYGAGATGAPGCQPSPGGQAGRLQAGGGPGGNCRGPVGANFVHYVFGGANNLPQGQDLATTFSCMASVGSQGCGFEHQLESVYAALHNPIPENQGFLRDDALLAVVFLTNEDDASAPTVTDVFDRNKVQASAASSPARCRAAACRRPCPTPGPVSSRT